MGVASVLGEDRDAVIVLLGDVRQERALDALEWRSGEDGDRDDARQHDDVIARRLIDILKRRSERTVEIEDDGMGMLMERLNEPMSSGIGLANVRERLRVYCHEMDTDPQPARFSDVD